MEGDYKGVLNRHDAAFKSDEFKNYWSLPITQVKFGKNTFSFQDFDAVFDSQTMFLYLYET